MLPFGKTLTIIYLWLIPLTTTTEESNNTNVKFILMWTVEKSYTPPDYDSAEIYTKTRNGQEFYAINNCPYTNCFITRDRNLFGVGAEANFDAVIFNGRQINMIKNSDYLPRQRSPKQKYIFVLAESVCDFYLLGDCIPMFTICNPIFDNFFNLTATIKLDADIRLSKIQSFRRNRFHTTCKEDIENGTIPDLSKKKKAVLWCATNCENRKKEQKFVETLKKELLGNGLTLDVYGCDNKQRNSINNDTREKSTGHDTSDHSSSEDENSICDAMKEEYFFYLDFDAIDTESNRCPIAQNSVPLVYGVESYIRFMPLGTYIDASKYRPVVLSGTIAHHINDHVKYKDFFAYRNEDTVYVPPNARSNLCSICSALNDEKIMNSHYTYKHFRYYWDHDYVERCKVFKPYEK